MAPEEPCAHPHTIITNGYQTCTECGMAVEILDFDQHRPAVPESQYTRPPPLGSTPKRGANEHIKLNNNPRFYNNMQYQENVTKKYMVLINTAMERMRLTRNQVLINEIIKYVVLINKKRMSVGKNFKIIISIIMHELFKKYHIQRSLDEIIAAMVIDDGPILEQNLTEGAMALRNAGKTKYYPKYFRLQREIRQAFPEIIVNEPYEMKVRKAIMTLIDSTKRYDLLDQVLKDFERLYKNTNSTTFPRGMAAGLFINRVNEEDRVEYTQQCMNVLGICRPNVKKYTRIAHDLLKCRE